MIARLLAKAALGSNPDIFYIYKILTSDPVWELERLYIATKKFC